MCDYREKCFMSKQFGVDSFGQKIYEPSLALFFVGVVFIGSLASGFGNSFHSCNACPWIT